MAGNHRVNASVILPSIRSRVILRQVSRGAAGPGRPGAAGLDPPGAMAQTRTVDTRRCAGSTRRTGPAVVLLDQTRLPAEEIVPDVHGCPALVDAIGRLVGARRATARAWPGRSAWRSPPHRGDDVAAAAGRARPRPADGGQPELGRRAGAALPTGRRSRPDTARSPPWTRTARPGCAGRSAGDRGGDAAASAAMAENGLSLVPDRRPHPDPLQHRCAGVGGRGDGVRGRPGRPPGGPPAPCCGWTRPGRCCRARG